MKTVFEIRPRELPITLSTDQHVAKAQLHALQRIGNLDSVLFACREEIRLADELRGYAEALQAARDRGEAAPCMPTDFRITAELLIPISAHSISRCSLELEEAFLSYRRKIADYEKWKSLNEASSVFAVPTKTDESC